MSLDAEKIEIEQLEMLIYGGRYEHAAALLLRLLDAMTVKGLAFRPSEHLQSEREQDHERRQMNTRLAGAITTMLASKKFLPPKEGYILLMSYKRTLRSIFMASGFGDMDHLHWHMLKYDANGQGVVENQGALFKLLLTVTPGSPQDEGLYRRWIKSLPLEVSLPFWLSFIDTDVVLDEKSDQTRQRVASMYSDFNLPEDFELPKNLLQGVINAWMLCSYMGYEEKHKPKIFLNKILKQFAEKNGVKPPVIAKHLPQLCTETGRKPKLVVGLERFTSSHAVYRCFRKRIDDLRRYFYLIGVGIEDQLDDTSKQAFDEVYTFSENEPFSNIAKKIEAMQADVLYFPSLGMEVWAVVLAQFRFAPIQMMSLGHPATSMSPVMDYALAEKTDPNIFGERVVYSDENASSVAVPHPDGNDFSYNPQPGEKVRIGVNAKLYKINYRLIKACQEIEARSVSPVEFVFFPASSGVTLDAFKVELSRYISATVYPPAAYPEFIDNLRTCDMVLNPFPFGNTNGIFDCAHIGLPFVCMDGKEPHSRVDVLLSEKLGYPEFLRTHSLEEYIQAAVRLVDDKELRQEIIQEIPAKRERSSQGTNAVSFGEVVYKLFTHHDTIQAGDERLIDIDGYSMPDSKTE
ncbi:hypothetical protein QWI17_15875 [Gilvimarinus sp. SDUM040013]|uniref:HMW1C N-terminal domain-containing protein n=1 Tax=Gilvimarinus gilvus TaxID=3058038 RepID=A0ABU4S1A3_9GAMM|nr:hypothetical protein [Gilvimarinus sp. SDUM040013]MDO3387320.1 hypothetical protein [Gilvimarinus sp. SDUM040013]MDX6849009.1 hypothetical protein [Gilvimarinus sp. SDUM040013]